MRRPRSTFVCDSCGAHTPRWLGRCPECGEWDALVERLEARAPSRPSTHRSDPAATVEPVPVAGVPIDDASTIPTGLREFDRVLGGGLVPGSVTLLGGEPGIGKSTLLLQVLAGSARRGHQGLLVSAEESATQVRTRADRVGATVEGVSVLSESSLPAILEAVDRSQPTVCVLDSIQTVTDPDLPGVAGSVPQVRECAQALVTLAKTTGVTVVLAGHVTKDGELAGPRTLEHVVDTVLAFEGDRHQSLRVLRVHKHRFGATRESGLFEMGSRGLVDVADPSGVFLADRRPDTPGSVVCPVVEGGRPVLVEVQALVGDQPPGPAPNPRRSAQGLDGKRLAMLLAVLQQRAGVPFGGRDVYVSVAGGLRVTEPGVDLGIALALAGAATGSVIEPGVIVVGEVGLGGEIRQVSQPGRRLSEAARLGFSRAIVPSATPDTPGIELCRVGTIGDATAAAIEVGVGYPQPHIPRPDTVRTYEGAH